MPCCLSPGNPSGRQVDMHDHACWHLQIQVIQSEEVHRLWTQCYYLQWKFQYLINFWHYLPQLDESKHSYSYQQPKLMLNNNNLIEFFRSRGRPAILLNVKFWQCIHMSLITRIGGHPGKKDIFTYKIMSHNFLTPRSLSGKKLILQECLLL